MEYNPNQAAWQRACQDTESFRKSRCSFWTIEIVGAAMFGVVGAFVGYGLTPSNASKFEEFAWPTLGGGLGLAAGLVLVFIGIFIWNLFRASYKQRNEARTELEQWKQSARFLKNIQKGDTISNQIINVPLLFQMQGKNTLASVTFDKCTFRGPCSIRLEKSEVKGADFKEKLEEIFIEISREGTYSGLARFVYCKFTYCRFENISIVGFRSTFDKFKGNSVEL